MSSLDRLIDLAKRTGDRLIIHDSRENRDVVILTVDEYERLALGKKDVRALSSNQLLDQINRDIAVWRADKDLDERWAREEFLEDEFDEEGPFDPFAEIDYHPDEWHTASSVLENRYKNKEWLADFENEIEDEIEEEIKFDNLPNFEVDSPLDTVQNIPFRPQDNNEVWQEEPVASDEPVFYEEPV